MPLQQMPNGAYVNIPDDITPEGMAKLEKQYAAPPPSKREQIEARRAARTAAAPRTLEDGTVELNPLTGDDAEVARKVEALKSVQRSPIVGDINRIADTFAHNVSFGADDVVSSAADALTAGGLRAVQKGDIGEIGRTYKNNRRALREYREGIREEHPIEHGVSTIAGILKNPIGAATGVGAIASKVAPGLKSAVDASRAGKMIAAAGNSGIGLGARAGFNQGFATSLMDHGDVGDALSEGSVGALLGGGASAVLGGAKALRNIARTQAPEEASNVAYDRIASLLARSENERTGRAFTPHSARREIQATDAGGGDARFGDLIPEGQAWMSYLAKQPGLSSANHLVNAAKDRMGDAGDRFASKVRSMFGGTPSAFAHKNALEATRKATGQATYTDEVMNRQLAWSDELDKVFKNRAIKDALPDAQRLVEIDEGDVSQLAFATGTNQLANTTMQNVPSMRTMQYITQALDDTVGKAMRAGDSNTARMYSTVNRRLKNAIADVNPELAHANALQRDLFERADSLDLGTKIISGLRNKKSEEVLAQIKSASNLDDVRVGFADALLKLREGSDDPVRVMRQFMRSPEQRAVLTHMFGGNKELNAFDRFMRREIRSNTTDKMVASGRQMAANLLKEPSMGGAEEAVGDMAKSGLQGVAFGGPLGGVSRLVQQAKMRSSMMSPHAKAELSRILGGKGDDVKAGVDAAAKRKLIRERRDRRHSQLVGKAPYAVAGGYSNSGE